MTNTIEDLPNEVLEMILNFLPPYKDLENCQLVCSHWAALVKNVRCRRDNFFRKSIQEGSLCWKMWPPDDNETPPRRNGHSATIFKGKMYIFGGEIRMGRIKRISQNDLWAFDLSTRQWEEYKVQNEKPSPKFDTSMVSHEDKLIVFGGYLATPLLLTDELHVYNLREKRWIHPEVSTPWPPAMFGHSATIHGDKMVIFGGYHKTDLSCSNDVWILNLDNFTWTKQETSQEKPISRMSHYQIRLNDDNILIFGGHKNVDFTDMWLLTMKSPVWTWKEISVIPELPKINYQLFTSSPACKIGQKFIILPKNRSDPTQNQDFPGMLICDLSHVLDTDNPHAQWLEPREVRISDPVENIKDVVCSTLVPGNGELIHFGGRLSHPIPLSSKKLHFINPF
ncbi:uncharacterized protein DMENIID0001_133840 [Sergentomyia squamirostris]